jgi:hypothetical protein
MQIAPEITFKGSGPSPAAREAILKEIVNHSRVGDARHGHVEVAIRDAFANARRQVDALAV